MIEVEARSFISKEKYDELLEKMEEEGDEIGEYRQITFYLSGDKDLRIQRSEDSAKLWLKGGEIHEREREEIEVAIDPDGFQEVVELFESLGYEVEVKWYRLRHKFNWNRFEVCVDHTAGYGRIVEVELMCERMERKKASGKVERALKDLDIERTPKKVFEDRFEDYTENWKDILEDKNLERFNPTS